MTKSHRFLGTEHTCERISLLTEVSLIDQAISVVPTVLKPILICTTKVMNVLDWLIKVSFYSIPKKDIYESRCLLAIHINTIITQYIF